MAYNKPMPTAPSASNLSFMNRNITYNNNYEWSPPQPPKVSNMKAILSQCLAVLPIFLINFNNVTFSIFIAFNAYKLVDMHSTMYILGLIIGGVPAQIIGGRPMIMLGAIVLVGGWLTLQWVSSTTVLFIWTVYVVGLTGGMMQSPFYVYLAEIVQPNARGVLMATVNVSFTIGLYFYTNVWQIVPLRTFRWINLIFPVVGFIVMIILPESPYWLANKGRYQRAESSLAWFRGWTTPINVKTESTTIINHAQNNSSVVKLLGKNSFYICLLVVSYVFAIKAFSGTDYLFNIMVRSSPQGKFNVPLISSYGYNLAAIGSFVAVAVISQRVLILSSLFSGSLAFFSITVLNVVSDKNLISPTTASSLLLIFMIVGIVVLRFGLGHVPLLLNAELFPSRLRYIGAGIGLFIMNLLEYGSRSIYTKNLTVPPFTTFTLFLMLGCINAFGFLTLCWLFPKNKNKSIVEIEQSCNSINDLRRKKSDLTVMS